LIVRIKVLLSTNRLLSPVISNQPVTNNNVQIGNLIYNPTRNNLQNGINVQRLTARESELLDLLCLNKHDVISRKELLQKLWGDDNFFNARSLDVFITKLRKHLEADPEVQLINIRGVGYKLVW
jgi:DNA-binding response OmpR family regulator